MQEHLQCGHTSLDEFTKVAPQAREENTLIFQSSKSAEDYPNYSSFLSPTTTRIGPLDIRKFSHW